MENGFNYLLSERGKENLKVENKFSATMKKMEIYHPRGNGLNEKEKFFVYKHMQVKIPCKE